MIQIDFFDQDVINSLVPIRTMRPDYVYFLVSEGEGDSEKADNMREAIDAWNWKIRIEYLEADTKDIFDIKSKLSDLLSRLEGEAVYMDLTGGADLAPICGYSFCIEHHITPIYMDWEKDCMINAANGDILKPLAHIKMQDYMAAAGAKRLGGFRLIPKPEEYQRIIQMSEFLFRNTDKWNAFHYYLSNLMSQNPQMKFIVPSYVSKAGGKYQRIDKILAEFCKNGFLRGISDYEYEFTSKEAKSYMLVYGFWLEAYIYIKALDLFDEDYVGVVIDWDREDCVDTQDNELDVIVMKNSVPIFISCKMCRLKSEYVYEVGYLAKRFGGNRAKSIIATTQQFYENERQENGIQKRLEKMRVGLIETKDFAGHSAKEIFEQAIKMCE